MSKEIKTFALFLAEAPTLFVLFILSHGNAHGKIETDHKGNDHKFFTTKSVFQALKKNAFLKDALKLVFIGVSLTHDCSLEN